MAYKQEVLAINALHILNDGFKASLLLFLPFIAKDLSISLTKVGLLGTAMNSLEIVMAIPAGIIATKIGGFRLLILLMIFYGLGYFFASLSSLYFMIILAFILAGIGFGMFHSVAFSIVSKMFTKEERGTQLGNFTALAELGRMGISSAATLIIVAIGWRQTAFIISAFIALLFVVFYIIFSQKKQKDGVKVQEHTGVGPSYKDVLRNKKFIFATASFVLDTLASGSLFIFIPFLLLKRGIPPVYLGALTSTFFLGNMFGKVFLGRLVDRLGNTKVFIISEFLMAFFILVLAVSHDIPTIIIASILLGMFTKGTIPILTAMVSESVDHHGRYEKAFSLNAVFVGMGSTIAPLFLGFLSDRYGIVNAFYTSSLLAIIATVPAFFYRRTQITT